MRRIANLFMWLFLLDGCISVTDELLRYNAADEGLLGLRSLVALTVLVMGVVVYGGMLFDRRLPKLVLLPQCLFAFWGLVGLWPLPFFVLSDNLGVIIAGLQVSLGLLPFFVLRGPGRAPFLRQESFTGSGFGVGNLLVGIAPTLFVVPAFLLFFAGAGIVEAIHDGTAGFMTVEARGVTMQERVYRRGTKTVRLVGMIHIGEQSFYDQLTASITEPNALILAEGVSDREGLLTSPFTYNRVAGVLGLSSQESMHLKGKLIVPEDLDKDFAEENSAHPDILRADLDLSDFDAQTVEFLNVLGEKVFSRGDLAEGLKNYNEWVNSNMNQARYETLMYDILTRRNLNLLEYLKKSLGNYDVIVIPWGALHMRGIEEGVKAQGFRLRQTRERLSVDFNGLLAEAG